MENFKAEFYFSAFKKLKKAFFDFTQTQLADYSLSPNEIEVVSYLTNKSCGSEIAKEFHVSKTLVSRSVASLVKKGFLIVEDGVTDKRERILSLTEKGRELYTKIQSIKEQFFSTALKHFEEREMRVLEALIKLLLRNVSELETQIVQKL